MPGAVRKGVRLTAAQIGAFLETLATTGNVRAGARAGTASVASFYNRRRLDRGFGAAWVAAKAVADERIEAATLALATARLGDEGASSPVDARGADRGV